MGTGGGISFDWNGLSCNRNIWKWSIIWLISVYRLNTSTHVARPQPFSDPNSIQYKKVQNIAYIFVTLTFVIFVLKALLLCDMEGHRLTICWNIDSNLVWILVNTIKSTNGMTGFLLIKYSLLRTNGVYIWWSRMMP